MQKTLRLLAATLLLVAVAYWLAAGPNGGWTQTDAPIKTTDPVTGLDRIDWQKHFVPGVDFLGGALIAAGVLAGASFFPRNKKPGTQQPVQLQMPHT